MQYFSAAQWVESMLKGPKIKFYREKFKRIFFKLKKEIYFFKKKKRKNNYKKFLKIGLFDGDSTHCLLPFRHQLWNVLANLVHKCSKLH
jgi:hypothetical protein